MSNYTTRDIDYDKSFKAFLASTNEKEVIASALSGIVQIGANILDIGAGDGTMTRQILSKFSPSTYTAVEANNTFCDALEATGGGISTISGIYPEVDSALGSNRYDNVLSIYSTPLDRHKRRKFLQRAFSRTAGVGSSLIVVSFGGIDRWTRMITEIETILPPQPTDKKIHQIIRNKYPMRLRNDCDTLGETTARLITSEIVTDSPEELYYAVAFTATAGMSKALKRYTSSKKAIVDVIKQHAPSGRLTQSHSLVTIKRTEGRDGQ